MYQAKNEILEHWVPSKTKVRKNGEPVIFRNIVRKMLLSNPDSIFEPKEYRITQVRRSGITYAISGLIPPKNPLWSMPVLDSRTLPVAQWRKAEKSMNRAELLVWLSKRIDNAGMVLQQLETDEPSNKKERKAA